jgi:transposase
MHFIYGLAAGNAREAARLYRVQFPNRRHPERKTFQILHQRLRETGSLRPLHHVGRPRQARTITVEEEILARAAEQQSTSTRAIALHMGTTQSTVWRVLHDNQLHPYHPQEVQGLCEEDFPRRVQFCQWSLQRCLNEPHF